jgi:hypothetical protein
MIINVSKAKIDQKAETARICTAIFNDADHLERNK